MSTWVQHLPPVLWRDDPDPPDVSVDRFLSIFEKLLTGIDDGVEIGHGEHTHPALAETIGDLSKLFDPWTTPPDFLAWLAGWVALDLPEIWDDYQQRKATSEISEIHRRRGLKRGADQHLDLYTVATTRPRVAIDDCSRLLWCRPESERFAEISTLVGHGPLVAPTCMTAAPDGSLFLGDFGSPGGNDESVWRFPPPGRYSFDGSPREPSPLPVTTMNLEFPVGLATVKGSPYDLYVLDRVVFAPQTALWKVDGPSFATASTVANKGTLQTVWPVDITQDPTTQELFILDRGSPAPAGLAALPKIIEVQLSPFSVTVTPLTTVLEPLSICLLPGGDLLIGDGGDQKASVPGDLVRIDRSSAPWGETSLLGSLPAWTENSVVSPVALQPWDDGTVFVVDTGLKPHQPDLANPFVKKVAEPAVVHRVDLATSVVDRASEFHQLVHPSGAVAIDGDLYISDRGEYSDPVLAGAIERVWRANHGEFGIVIHFSEQRPTTQRERRRLVRDVHDIVNRQSPAHSDRAFVFAV